MMEATPLLEILPANPNVTKREFVPITRVERIYLDMMSGHWGALLTDGTYVALKNSPDGSP